MIDFSTARKQGDLGPQAAKLAPVPDPPDVAPYATPDNYTDRLANLPDVVKDLGRAFLFWKIEPDPDATKKPKKVPYYPSGQRRQGKQGDDRDRGQLVTLSEAMTIFDDNPGKFTGIGLAMFPEHNLTAFDFDNCVTDRKLPPEFAAIIADTYAEISPSLSGVRGFLRGSCEKLSAEVKHLGPKCGIETFSTRQFVTLTGDLINSNGVATINDDIRQRLDAYRVAKIRAVNTGIDRMSKAYQDPTYQQLKAAGFVLREDNTGKIGIRCPFESEHTTGSDGTDTVYFLPYTGGHPNGHFDCKHGHCLNRTDTDFRRKMGMTPGPVVAEELGAEAGGYLKDALFTAGEFRKIDVPPKTYHLFPWVWSGSYGMISGERGIGKTFFGLAMADAITRGAAFGPWRGGAPASCLYVEGEMPMTDDQERIKIMGLDSPRPEPLYILSDAYICEALKRPSLKLTNEETRQYLRELILSKGIKFVFCDNVASLSPRVEENSKMEWDPINEWLRGLRYAGVGPWLVHHLGKNGEQRGTSGREDNLDISIKLSKPHGYKATDGARFVVDFTKKRIGHADLPLVADTEMQYRPDITGKHVWTYGGPVRDQMLGVLDLLSCGKSQKEAADDLGTSKSQVSKLRKKLDELGYIAPGNILTKNGECALIEAGIKD